MNEQRDNVITPRVRALSLRLVAETLEEALGDGFQMEYVAIRGAAAELERLAAERDAAWNAVRVLRESIEAKYGSNA